MPAKLPVLELIIFGTILPVSPVLNASTCLTTLVPIVLTRALLRMRRRRLQILGHA